MASGAMHLVLMRCTCNGAKKVQRTAVKNTAFAGASH
jgi:hypothetical protein